MWKLIIKWLFAVKIDTNEKSFFKQIFKQDRYFDETNKKSSNYSKLFMD